MVECSLLVATVLKSQVGPQYIPGHVRIVCQVGEQGTIYLFVFMEILFLSWF